MPKTDFKKEYKDLFSARLGKIEVIEVPALNYIKIDGKGDPNESESFQQSTEALYSLSYTLRSMLKKGPEALEYSVLPLEGLWWAGDGNRFSPEDKDAWQWTLMIMQPDLVTTDMVEEARSQVAKKKKDLTTVPDVRFELFEEGTAAQTMHAGSYDDEASTISSMNRFIALNGFHPNGKHHEIYLNDPRRSAPEKLRTILRQPVKKV